MCRRARAPPGAAVRPPRPTRGLPSRRANRSRLEVPFTCAACDKELRGLPRRVSSRESKAESILFHLALDFLVRLSNGGRANGIIRQTKLLVWLVRPLISPLLLDFSTSRRWRTSIERAR